MRRALILGSCILLLISVLYFYPNKKKTSRIVAKNDSSITEIRNSVVSSETAWIASLQTTNGGILTYSRTNQSNIINPYFANIACMGLSLDKKYLPNVRKYIQWYINNINSPDNLGLNGTIYDYSVSQSGVETSMGTYDSADSYAATFISLLRSYYEKSKDESLLKQYKQQIYQIANVMIQLMGTNQLTIAKPNYPVELLMDNCEVFKGLEDMSFLCQNVFQDSTSASYFNAKKNALQTSFFLNFSNGNEFYIQVSGITKQQANWSVWYPDATSQLFPILTGMIPPSSVQAQHIYAKLNQYYKDWPSFKTFQWFPRSLVANVAVLMGDVPRAQKYLINTNTTFLKTGHSYPWQISESGWIIQMIQKINS
jgi:hypothetical protein